jgi:hypothetical protein
MDKQQQEGKPVDVVCINAFKHEGEHIPVGKVLYGVPAEDAINLAGSGRVRLATAEDIDADKKPKKARAEA